MNTFKILAVAVALTFGAVSVNAQKDKTFSFIDAAGNEVADGSTVIFYAEKKTPFPGMEAILGYTIQADFALKVKNNTNSAAEATLHVVAPENPTHGIVQICFHGVCDDHTKGEFTTNSVPMAGNAVKELHSEWVFVQNTPGRTDNFESEYGTEDVSITLMNGSKAGPTVNIHSVYADPTGITDIESADNATEVARYDLNGRKLTAPQKGLNIIKLSNGKTVKKLIK